MNLGQRLVLLAGMVLILVAIGLAVAPSPSAYSCGSPLIAAFQQPSPAEGHWQVYVGTNIYSATTCRNAARAQLTIAATIALLTLIGVLVGHRLLRTPSRREASVDDA
jgi:uncharacterized membrane protein YfcA